MTDERLIELLMRSFSAPAAAGVDMVVALSWPGAAHPLALRIRGGRLTVLEPEDDTPDVHFYFRSFQMAHDILAGKENAIDAFMRGDFRSDGYLMMAFKLMEMFRSRSLPPTPND